MEMEHFYQLCWKVFIYDLTKKMFSALQNILAKKLKVFCEGKLKQSHLDKFN